MIPCNRIFFVVDNIILVVLTGHGIKISINATQAMNILPA